MSFYVPNDSNVTVSRSILAKAALKKSFTAIKVAIAFLILIYLVFALTIVRFVPGLAGGAGLVLTKNDTFYGGIIPVSDTNEEKTQVLIDTAGYHDGSIIDNAKQAFTINSNTAVVEVHAGPTGKLSWENPDIVTVTGKPMPGPMPAVTKTERNPLGSPINEKEYLHNEYLGLCISGACNEGEIILFDENQVMGVPVFRQ